jgi:malonate-semialdehyde dehydrogenase (acetylating)/methylmalonate-semialdehyde dehydrogenase
MAATVAANGSSIATAGRQDPNETAILAAKIAADPPYYQVYDSREEMLKVVREYAISKGYVIVIKRSSPERNIYIGCDRGGVYKDRIQAPDGQKRRKTNSRQTGCNFRLYARKSTLHSTDGKWHIKVLNGEHNHEPEQTLLDHPGARVITPDQKKMINFLVSENMPPRKIIAALKQGYPDLLIIPRDIYNLKMAWAREERLRREAELPEARAKREKLEKLAIQHSEQKEELEREQKEQREKLEKEQQEQRDQIEKTGQLEQRGQFEHREQLEQLQELQQLQKFEQLEELANHVRGGV